MTKITLTELELTQLWDIKDFDLGIIMNNSLNGLDLNLSDTHYASMYDILLTYSDVNIFVQEFLHKYLKYNNDSIIKPYNINSI